MGSRLWALLLLLLTSAAAAANHKHNRHTRTHGLKHHHHRTSALVADRRSLEQQGVAPEGSSSRMRTLDEDARWKLYAYQLWKQMPSPSGGYRTWRTFAEDAWVPDALRAVSAGGGNAALADTLQLAASGAVPVQLTAGLLNDLVNVYLVTPAAARRFDEFEIAVRNLRQRGEEVEALTQPAADAPASMDGQAGASLAPAADASAAVVPEGESAVRTPEPASGAAEGADNSIDQTDAEAAPEAAPAATPAPREPLPEAESVVQTAEPAEATVAPVPASSVASEQ